MGSRSGGTAAAVPPPRQRTRLDPSVRRELIIDAAETVFAGRDPAEVTFEEIAEAAGVSRALVYNYFGDKGGLVTALYFRSFERLDGALRATLEGGSAGDDRLRAVVACYLGFAAEHAAAWKLIGTAEAVGHPEVQRARRVRFERMAKAWGGTAQARIVARAVVGMLEAATLDWLENDDLSLDEAVDLLHALLATGLAGLQGDHGLAFPSDGPGGVVPTDAA